MPVFRIGEKLCYYVHVPKCGGSSIEHYLAERFGPVGFRDNWFLARKEAERWSRTSPQHIDWASFQMLLPAEMLDMVFAVVRNPVSRLVSAYNFQIDVEKTVPEGTGFSEWLRDQLDRLAADPFALDNHVRPQVDFMPEDCAVFHLEHGLDAVVEFLDQVAGDSDGPRTIGHANKQRSGSSARRTKSKPDPEALALIRDYYAADFERFGYVVDQPGPVTGHDASRADGSARKSGLATPRSPLQGGLNRIIRGVSRRLR